MGKKRNRKHSKIDKLPADLREAVDMMLQGDFTYEDVANFIRDNAGISISTTSVWRYATGLNATVESLRIVEQNFRTLMDEMERYPNLDTTEAIARLLSHKVLTAIQNVDESMWSEIDPAELMKQSTNLMRAISYKNDMDVKVKNLFRRTAAHQLKLPLGERTQLVLTASISSAHCRCCFYAKTKTG